jgi:cell wall-associated NlpC family hydrolase
MRAWQHAGVYLSHDAKVQYLQSTPISYDQLQIGDLIFWTTGGPSQIFHVALYDGNDSDVVAPHTGAYVQIEQPIWDNGYQRLYARP